MLRNSASKVKGPKQAATSPGKLWRPPDQAPHHWVVNKNESEVVNENKTERVNESMNKTVERTIVAQLGTERLVQLLCKIGDLQRVATLDGGSQLNLITLELARELNLIVLHRPITTSTVQDVQG